MSRRRKVDASKVIEAVESGRMSRDVMDSYGLEKPQSETGRRRGRKRRGEGGPAVVTTVSLGDVTISKRGSLVLPKTMLDELGYGLENVFVARRTKVGILLKPAQ